MIDRAPGLILPLVHHFVQECLDCFIHSVFPYVPAADHYLGGMTRLPPQRVVSEPGFHPA
jgi:hypothetical protein